MDYRERAKELLRRRKSLLAADLAIEEELSFLQEEFLVCDKRIKEFPNDSVYQDRLISLLADLDDCRFRKSVVERELAKIKRGLCQLDDYHRDLIEGFYCSPAQAIAEDMMFKWYKERSAIYRDKLDALDTFTRSVYGVLQI